MILELELESKQEDMKRGNHLTRLLFEEDIKRDQKSPWLLRISLNFITDLSLTRSTNPSPVYILEMPEEI